ncbi:MAG: hypothetical protein RSD14_03085, partial [Clostridia bacterium]
IIVIIILAAAVILTLNKNNPIENAKEATFKSNIANMQSELNIYLSKKISEGLGEYKTELLSANKEYLIYNNVQEKDKTIKDVLSSIKNHELKDFAIISGKLRYIGVDNKKIDWAISAIDRIENAKIQEVSQDSNTITLKNTKAGELKDFKIYGNSVQNGIPTPENPVKIESLGENGEIGIKSNKNNLLPYSNFAKTNTDIWKENQNVSVSQGIDYYQVIYKQNTSTPGIIWLKPPSFLELGKTYTISANVKGINTNYINFGVFGMPITFSNLSKTEFKTISSTFNFSGYTQDFLALVGWRT